MKTAAYGGAPMQPPTSSQQPPKSAPAIRSSIPPHAGSSGALDAQELVPAGTQVGEYIIEKKIGEGGMGTVYSARHPVIGKRVAIKVISPAFAAEPEAVERFVREARSVNEIGHRNIIDIFAFGRLQIGLHYFVMEYLDGRSLQDEMGRFNRPLTFEETVGYLRPVSSALVAAHQRGIIHRDLKPENIFVVDPDGQPLIKLLDFGLAKLAGDGGGGVSFKTRTGIPMGTPYYMAPEQCLGKAIDQRADIYALGIIVYQMMTSRLPFYAESYLEVLQQQLGAQPVPPKDFVPIPDHVNAAILWSMAKDPNARPQTVREFWDAFEGVEGAGARPLTPPPQSATVSATPSYYAQPGVTPFAGGLLEKRRARWPLAVAAVAVLGLGLGGLVLWRGKSRTPTPGVAAQATEAPAVAAAAPAPSPPVAVPVPVVPATGTVRLDVVPGDSAVTVDNLPVAGGSEVTLTVGMHTLRASKAGFRTREQTFEMRGGETIVLNVPLERERVATPRPAAARPAQPRGAKLRDKDDTARPSWAQ